MPNPTPILPMHYLFFIIILFTVSSINQSNSARNLDYSPKHNIPPHHHHHQQISVSFSMPNILRSSQALPSPPKQNDQNTLPPFSKPLGDYFNFTSSPYRKPPRTLDLDGLTMSFPALQELELELGKVSPIEEDVYEGTAFIGKAEGVLVEDIGSYDHYCRMVAMTARFVGGDHDRVYEDGLRFFGVHKDDDDEWHVAVIGGTGKFEGANGYAVVNTLNFSSSTLSSHTEEDDGSYKFLLFNVYLGYAPS